MGAGETHRSGPVVALRRAAAASMVLASICAGAFAVSPDRSQAAVKRPNVVLVMTDDQRFDEMAAMPNTRRLLGSKGTTFSNSFITFPLCCPSRTSFMSGQMAHNHGIGGNFAPTGYHGLSVAQQRNLLPAWLQKAGYRTSHVGKYLNGYGDDGVLTKPPGWTDWHGTIDQTSYDYFNTRIRDNNKTTELGSKAWNTEVMRLSGVVSRQELTSFGDFIGQILQLRAYNTANGGTFGTTSRKRYLVDELSNRAVGFIRSTRRSSKPFFLQYAPPAPHREDVPEQALYRGINPRVPTRYVNLVKDKVAPRTAPSFDEADISDKPAGFRDYFPSRLGSSESPGHPSLEMLDNYYRGRFGSLRAADDGVKRIVDALTKAGKIRNTLIIFTSDNGWMMGEHRLIGDKFVPYEESIRVPLIVRGPGFPANKKVGALVANTDLTSTVIKATKINPSPGRVQDGTSLIPVAKSGQSEREFVPIEATRSLFVLPGFPYEWDSPYHGIRTDRWKYVKWECPSNEPDCTRPVEEELYDLQSDPFELSNLIDDDGNLRDVGLQSVLDDLRAKAEAAKTCSGQSCFKFPL